MIGSIIELILGWFVTYRVPKMLGAKGTQAKVVMLIGILLMIAGVVSFFRVLLSVFS